MKKNGEYLEKKTRKKSVFTRRIEFPRTLEYKKENCLILSGEGHAVYWYIMFLKEHNIEPNYIVDKDESKWGTTFLNIPVTSLDTVLEKNSKDNIKIIIAAPKFREEIKTELLNYVSENKIYSFEAEIYYSFTKDVEEYRKYILNHWKDIEEVYQILEDDFSRKTLMSFLKGRISGNQEYYTEVMTENQYYPQDVFALSEEEILVELGGNDGNTLLEFLNRVKRKYHKIYCFEPDRKCINQLEAIVDKEKGNIVLIRKGAWFEKNTLTFESNSEYGASKISAADTNSAYSIEVTSLDEEIKDKVTFIKMDIEGAELNALKGAANIITGDYPKLAVCVYHKKEDIIEIIQYLKKIAPKYKFYLRHHNWGATETVLYAVV